MFPNLNQIEKLLELFVSKAIIREIVEETPKEKLIFAKPPVQTETYFNKAIAYLTPQIHSVWDVIKLIIFFILTGLTCFYVFWAFASMWPIFNFVHFLTYYPFFIPFQFLFIFFVILISGVVIGKSWYYITSKINRQDKKRSSTTTLKREEVKSSFRGSGGGP